ncbi:TRAP transporter substrate-binding protein DctP [Marinomonas sp. FW-1]|uniref:TRAP transporter substrate-binding protein DctP n=1 Tax=Marinomonas sp. FW-1 TaxID=2071621 RepID=UPI0010C00394|nr:TRAP transporter substrate-binding protein DctP [Marinomonas sp. FW-1]
MKKLTATLLFSAAVLTASISAHAKTYRLATNTVENAITGYLIQDFVEGVAEKTDNRVKIRVSWNGVLGTQSQYLQAMQIGVIDMGMINSATLETLAPEIGVINLPYIFRSKEEYGLVLNNPDIQEMINSYVADSGLLQIGYLSNGFRSIYAAKPMKSIDDVKGLKLRTLSSDSYIKMINLFGAVPTPLPFGEVYPSLQQKIIDGAEGGLSALWDLKFGEVAKYGLKTEQTRLTDFILASKKFMDKLSPEDREIVLSEMKRVSSKSIETIDENIEERTKIAVEKMGVEIHEVDKTPFIEAVKPMYVDAMNDDKKKAFIEKIFELENREM